MTIQNGFFKSINGDRRYLAEFFTSYFASFIGNGVFPNPSTNLQVIANQNFATIVRPGKGWINGHYLNNDDNIVINHQPPDGVLRRIDRIVFAVNLDSRSMDIYLKQGIPSSNAQAPELLRNSTIYELALADIAFNPGMVSISQSNITDQRMNGQLCGIVHGVVEQLDTTTLFNQYQQFLVEKGIEFDQQLAVNQQVFDDWFAQLNDILDGDVAANLANTIIMHTNNATSQKHIEVVSNIPTNLANKGLLLQIDDLDNPNNPPSLPTSVVLNDRIEITNQRLEREVGIINNNLNTKASLTDVANIATANPVFINNLSEATDQTKVYVLISDGYIYTYNSASSSFVNTNRLYQSTGIDDDSVTPRKTDFLEVVIENLYNKATVTDGRGINFTNGNLYAAANFSTTDFIPVKQLTQYVFTHQVENRVFYDANKVIISGSSVAGTSLTTPENAKFIRFMTLTIRKDTFMMIEGNVLPSKYYAYGQRLVNFRGVEFSPSVYESFPPPTNISRLSNKKWNVLGDSITFGAYTTTSYHQYIAEKTGVTVRNYGISSSTVSTIGTNPMVNRYQNMNNDADIISVFGGVNDAGYGSNTLILGDINSTDTGTFYGAYNVMLDGLIKKYPTKLIFTVTPIKANDGFRPRLGDIAQAVREVSAKYSVPCLDLYNTSGIALIDEQQSLLQPDKLHPNALGHRNIAGKFLAFIENNLPIEI